MCVHARWPNFYITWFKSYLKKVIKPNDNESKYNIYDIQPKYKNFTTKPLQLVENNWAQVKKTINLGLHVQHITLLWTMTMEPRENWFIFHEFRFKKTEFRFLLV